MAGFLSKMFNSLGLSGSSGESVLGIDIGSSAIKVVQLKRSKGAAVLETYGEIALGPYAGLGVGKATRISYDKLREALGDVLREASTTTKRCAISIPFSSSLTNVIELPAVGDDRLDEMVPIEARKYIPVPTSEVTLDWFRLPQPERSERGENESGQQRQQTTEVLLVAIHNDVLETYQQLASDLELQPRFFEIEAFSTVRATLGRGIAPVLLIDVGAASTKIFVVERGVVRTSHSVNKGGQDISQRFSKSAGMSFVKAEEQKRESGIASNDEGLTHAAMLTVNYIFSEANRVLLNYQKRNDTAVERVVLSGGGALLPGFAEQAQEEFGLPVEYANPFEKIQTPAFLQDTLTEAGPTFAVSVGLALRHLQEIG